MGDGIHALLKDGRHTFLRDQRDERKEWISCWAFVGHRCGAEFPGVGISLVKMLLNLCRERKAVKVELEI